MTFFWKCVWTDYSPKNILFITTIYLSYVYNMVLLQIYVFMYKIDKLWEEKNIWNFHIDSRADKSSKFIFEIVPDIVVVLWCVGKSQIGAWSLFLPEIKLILPIIGLGEFFCAAKIILLKRQTPYLYSKPLFCTG